MKQLLVTFLLFFIGLIGYSQKGYDDDVIFKVYYENGTHYLIKYYPYGQPYDIDNNGVKGQISLVDVYEIVRWFDKGMNVKIEKVGRTFSNYYFKSDTPYMKQQVDFAKEDAKNFPKEWGVVPNKPKKI